MVRYCSCSSDNIRGGVSWLWILLLVFSLLVVSDRTSEAFHVPASSRRRQWGISSSLPVVAFQATTTPQLEPVADNASLTSTTTSATNTPSSTPISVSSATSIYPTRRGTTVDARQIVQSSVYSRNRVGSAILVAHCLLATPELAQEALALLYSTTTTSSSSSSSSTTRSMDFATLAATLSACNETRHDGGVVGWINRFSPAKNDNDEREDRLEDGADDLGVDQCLNNEAEDGTIQNINTNSSNPLLLNNAHLDLILPPEAQATLVHLATKPGDVVRVDSARGVHLVQILDVMADVRQMAVHRRRRKFHQQPSINEFSLENLTYQIESMGCQMNTADSERIEGQLLHLGVRPHNPTNGCNTPDQQSGSRGATTSKGPDIVVLNTCSIRDHAEQKVYSYLGPHLKRKREGDAVTIVVAGCVAQQEGKALLHRAPEIDLVLGPQYANRIGDLLEDVIWNGNQVVATAATHIMEDSTKPRRGSVTAAWVNVIYGCNERCTFCIVPTTRGVEQSRPVESILSEVTDLVQNQGYKEVTLLGQNIDAYGRDMIPKQKFSDLIRTVGSVPGLERLRFVTSHPRYMSMGVVEAVAETPAACESFHIPFQSGSNAILTTMGRGHTREKYLRIVDRIRTRIPDSAITADVIVGFPGETEQDFQDTLDLMKEVIFDSVNTAAYSPRPNTPAAVFDQQVDDETKKDRLQRINKLNLEHAAQRRARLLHETVEVLIEERNVKVPTQVMGRTRHGYIVYCDGDIDEMRGTTVHITIETTDTYYLSGRVVDGLTSRR